jgi:O-antigen/teichoic acid export membrane protein
MSNVNVNARTLPIALALVGGIIITLSIYAYQFAPNPNTGITVFGIIIGLIVLLLAVGVYYWEREKYYSHQVYYFGNH